MDNEDFGWQPCWEGDRTETFDNFVVPEFWNAPVNSNSSHIVAFPQDVWMKPESRARLHWGPSMLMVFVLEYLRHWQAMLLYLVMMLHRISRWHDSRRSDLFPCLESRYPKELILIPEFDLTLPDQGLYNVNGMSVVSALKTGAMGIGNIETSLISIYPNPSTGLIFIETHESSDFMVTITDTKGAEVLSGNVQGKTGFDLSNLERGVYFVKASNGDHVMVRKQVLK